MLMKILMYDMSFFRPHLNAKKLGSDQMTLQKSEFIGCPQYFGPHVVLERPPEISNKNVLNVSKNRPLHTSLYFFCIFMFSQVK